ncbi:acetolactate decarboxylase [Vibrio sp. S4M6]|uniref:acetolactate decarboxylase n=1 Tax=Vibrio sinus TaxID=2946865 RepID=UPI00202AB5AD|nr:acetolactate decarboxylase [Vibrio sinus]MCL9779816.1 acetolactate decarboxylase [Vibrio sinus]
MKKTLTALALTAAFASPLTFAQGTEYQYGTASALVDGQMGAVTTVKQVQENNNFGIGAGVGLGEVIMVNGHAYIAGPKGKGREMRSTDGLSYMTATKFKNSQTFIVKNIPNISTLERAITTLEKNTHLMYAIKVTGNFNNVEARSENYQTPPYTPIVTWMKNNQNVFNFKNTQGTLVMFQSPEFLNGVGVPGFHTHFISKNHQQVGHVFDVYIKNATVQLEPLNNLKLSLRTKLEPVATTTKHEKEKKSLDTQYMSGFKALETHNS